MIDRHSRIRISVEPDPEVFEAQLEERLLASLRRNVPASDYAPLGLLARDGGGQVVGGLSGGTSYGWLLVKILWVAEELRGHGLGVRIMAVAEEQALRRGCHGAWLDTSSARARFFYERLGYELFGKLENREGERPQGHARFFLCKRFAAAQNASGPERNVANPGLQP